MNELKAYTEYMQDRIKKATKNDHIIHGHMIYKCQKCGAFYLMHLEKGLEDPTDIKITGSRKPVPFCIQCIVCNGDVYHVLWNVTANTYGKNYRSYNEMVNQKNKMIHRNFFWNDPDCDHGLPILFEPDLLFSTMDQDDSSEYQNREKRRHGPDGKNGYKRPRSNKKLYEY